MNVIQPTQTIKPIEADLSKFPAVYKEDYVKKRVAKVLSATQCWWFMPASNGFGRAGIPDFIACIRGQMIAIETKSAKGKLTAGQTREISKISAADGCTFVVRDQETLKDLYNAIVMIRLLYKK